MSTQTEPIENVSNEWPLEQFFDSEQLNFHQPLVVSF